jgi:hypothetical protein
MKMNTGALLASTYALHRNDLANTTAVSVSLFTGGPLTQAEEDYINSATVTAASTGLISHSLARTNLISTRTELGQLFLPTFTQKKIGGNVHERIWMFTQRTEEMTGLANGDPTLAMISLHGGAAVYTAGNICRMLMLCSVGNVGSGAEFEHNGLIVTGQRYKINDFKFTIQNLLG